MAQPLRVGLSIVLCDPVGSRTLIVDDVVHGATAIEVDAEWLNEIVSQMRRCDNSSVDGHSEVPEVMVNADSICHVLMDIACHAVTSDPLITICRGNVIRQLNLQKIAGTTLAIPLDLILQRVFGRPSKH